eukprot:TRINITY_DN201_c0_g1_i2.p1 TRINITY_DN201_c0_g1~~TRINITY_DN201_c0_g1_i2.p1  ORF type:complete len:199 (-),score=60.02 TRINITY_DN201_c0_g1_i2:66-626(-)
MSSSSNFKLCVLGDGAVGKTAFTIQFCASHFVEMYDPTIEDSYTRNLELDGNMCRIEILDTAGQDEFSALRDQWIRESEGFILLYSITSRASFEKLTELLESIKRVKYDLNQIPVVLVGNKCDLDDKREVSHEEAKSFAKYENIDLYEASSKKRINIDESVFHLVRKIQQDRKPIKGNKKAKCSIL